MNGPNPDIDEKTGVPRNGSNYIIRPDGKRIDLRFVGDLNKTAEMIDQGFIVERHLRDGDMVLFNRQPSLHRMSIMAHEVRVMPHKTFRLHLCVCTPYNADFDGDEMNLHVPQSEEARAETRVLMRVQEQILSPRYGGPIIGALHDYVSAAFLLTRKKTLITKEDVWQLLLAGNYDGELPKPAIAHPDELWTGKQVFSLLLPHDVNITTKARTCRKHEVCKAEQCEYDSYVYIRNGILLSGVIDRRAIGADESESVLHVVVKDHGSDRAREFLDSLTQLLLEFLSHEGFSLGYSNVNLPDEGKKRIDMLIEEKVKEANTMIEAFQKGELEPLPGKSLEETLEMRIMSILAKARDSAGSVANDYMGISNSAVVMASTGAKGTQLNIAQMAACVGQQSIRGERILRGYRKRSLPHFKKNDIGPIARGFVRANYRSGLNPTEFFFHAQGGREGLVDTAVRTSTSGYLQRRLVNALQDLHVNYDIIVRTTEGDVVQMKYGEDGVDPMKSYHGKPVDIDTIIEEEISSEEN
jgi:DNA-directed RNA polymerase subunit A'